MKRIAYLAAAASALTMAFALTASASAPPVGPLPKGKRTVVQTTNGELVAVALPVVAGKNWRIARTVDRRVLRQVSEADVGNSVVLVFKAVGKGEARVVMALTRGETPKAYRASTYVVLVR
jgi:hypothetical protein